MDAPEANSTPTRAAPAPAKRPPAYPKAVDRLIAELGSLPGIGRRTAERLAFHVLKGEESAAKLLAQSIIDVKLTVQHCPVCSNLMDRPATGAAAPCPICADDSRDRATVLVVEQPKDLIALEQTGMYRGLYHVLMGRLSPFDGIGPEELTAAELLGRVADASKNPGGVAIKEVVLGLNPTVEGDGTALYLHQELHGRGVKISRLARGLPTGWQLEFANKAVLADAILGRQAMD